MMGNEKVIETAVLILAAGDNTAWRKAYPKSPLKQLHVINPPGETIIARIIRQCEKRGVAPTVITHEPEIIKESKGRYYEPKMRHMTCQTLLSTVPLWKERTIVLLGDVLFGKQGMNQVFACNKPYGSFGDYWETYGISFRKSEWIKVVKLCIKTMNLAHSWFEGSLGHMWNVYCGGPIKRKKKMDHSDFIHIKDHTMDIDMPGQWESFNIGVVGKGRLDDLP